jgi:putative FmdB family regulatory protein
MPLFEYYCSACKQKFELLFLAGRETREVCASCGSERVSRQLSRFAVASASESSDDDLGSADEMGGEMEGVSGGSDPYGSDDPRSCAYDDTSEGPLE